MRTRSMRALEACMKIEHMYIILLLIAISCVPKNDKCVLYSEIVVNDSLRGEFCYFDNDKQNGIAKEFLNDKLTKEVQIVNGKYNGLSTGYYQNGKTKFYVNYLDDTISGPFLYFDSLGRLVKYAENRFDTSYKGAVYNYENGDLYNYEFFNTSGDLIVDVYYMESDSIQLISKGGPFSIQSVYSKTVLFPYNILIIKAPDIPGIIDTFGVVDKYVNIKLRKHESSIQAFLPTNLSDDSIFSVRYEILDSYYKGKFIEFPIGQGERDEMPSNAHPFL